MNVGFACKIFDDDNFKIRTCILKNANIHNLYLLSKHNIETLDKIIDYLIKYNIKLFRISSDLIPFGSHPLIKFNWKVIFKKELEKIGEKAKKHNIRLSAHPGQYTIINSQNDELTSRSILDLIYHCEILDSLKMPSSCKIILHIGGVYGDKQKAISRFVANYKSLPHKIKKRLTIENDEHCYSAKDVLHISKKTNIPVVFDWLHHQIYNNNEDVKKIINKCRKTWKKNDGIQKIHYSQQAENRKIGSHSNTIDIDEFEKFLKLINKNTAVMLEVKDKNISVLKYIKHNLENKKR